MNGSHPDIMRRLLPPGSVVLGPMAGITEAPFRGICKRLGATLTYTEMISALGLHYNPDAAISRELLTFSAEEVPCAVQLFGADPRIMADQAAGIIERYGDDVALIDLNMGCPVSKVVCKGGGAALMRTPEQASAIVREVSSACERPVTVKFRSGWDAGTRNALGFARAMEAAGAAALCIHGRVRSQFYKGAADWETIGDVARAVSVPVIGSGDVFSARDACAMLERTGVQAVMVARGAQGNPWIFREARALIDTGTHVDPPTAFERIDMALEHASDLVEFGGERAIVRIRKHVAWYIHEMPGATRMRERVNTIERHAELEELLYEYREYLAERLT